jgi:hypothetical protein
VPHLGELEFAGGPINLLDFPRAVADGLFPELCAFRGQLPMQLETDLGINEWINKKAGWGLKGGALRLPELTAVFHTILDSSGIGQLAARAPKLTTLVVTIRYPVGLGVTTPHQNLRHLQLLSGLDVDANQFVAEVLSNFPRLAFLDVSVRNKQAKYLTLAPAAFGGGALAGAVCCPAMRELNVARQCGIRKEGLENIVRLFPNLRALDIRGCSQLSLDDFTAVVLEGPPPEPAACAVAPSPDAAAGGCAHPPHHHRLRLRKLRRVVASYLDPLPEALDFVEYECGAVEAEEEEHISDA